MHGPFYQKSIQPVEKCTVIIEGLNDYWGSKLIKPTIIDRFSKQLRFGNLSYNIYLIAELHVIWILHQTPFQELSTIAIRFTDSTFHLLIREYFCELLRSSTQNYLSIYRLHSRLCWNFALRLRAFFLMRYTLQFSDVRYVSICRSLKSSVQESTSSEQGT